MSASRSVVFDSYAMLAYLQQEDGCDKVKKLLKSGGERNVGKLLNEINAGEIYYILCKTRSKVIADTFLTDILPALPLDVVGNTLDDIIAAASLKADFTISYADAFAAATAIKYDAILLTGDNDFRQLEHLIKIDWLPGKNLRKGK